ncbi:dTDP-4-dehydrorhamnose reductase [Nonlabens spongiae]|uniref:dTDP-4-dehydrorhamnose reductase n=1 Tax=Nonlabens spongiae TaxID=331648 RepID=A0A1W6MLP1_9FLAO|nr:dTDP-4-dehydrorhamnose reductase [Nonlabens spongiae]ARN78518.1 dTDP-4-dehydrorhamnose reductase [Nonlabens spongiae]
MKILITGAQGMLGQAIGQALTDHEVVAVSKKDFDLTCPHEMDRTLRNLRPDYVINCAAYTAVDLAEKEKEKSIAVNGSGVEKLAQICNQYNSTLIHFSTDYVFNGSAIQPYTTDATVDPINAYGYSKLIGEKAITRISGKFYVFRISWLYAPHGKNFFRWVAESEQSELSIVDTQTGSPTSALSVADFVRHLVSNDPEHYGIYHFTNTGEWTWYAFAKAINEKLNLNKRISAVSEFKTAAKRPEYSVMDTSRTSQVFNYTIRTIDEALDKVVSHYKN